MQLLDILFRLLNQVFDPLFDLFLSRSRVVADQLLSSSLSLVEQPLDVSLAPSVPFGDLSFSLGSLFGGTSVLFGLVLLVESSRVLLELSSDLSLQVFGEERRRSGSPQELLELFNRSVGELLSLEVPEHVPRFGLDVSSSQHDGQETYAGSP